MNWDAVGAIGQMLGSVVTCVALVYLALQVRQAQQEGKRTLSQGRSEALRDLFAWGRQEEIVRLALQADRMLGSANVSPLHRRLTDQAGMTLEDAYTYTGYEAAWWNYQLHVISNLDDLSAMERSAFEFGIRNRYRPSSVGRLFYETIKPFSHPDVVRYIDGVLAQPL